MSLLMIRIALHFKFQEFFETVFAASQEHEIPTTFFELATMMGLLHFQRQACEAVVLEVGLGGLLDATNVVDADVCVITSVQLDHMSILGDTVEEIAVQKAGIMRRGVPVLVGPDAPLVVLEVGTALYLLAAYCDSTWCYLMHVV